MPHSPPIDTSLPDAVTVVLAHRRRRGFWLAAAAIGLLASAVWSHWRAPPDAGNFDGQTVACDRVVDGETIVVTGAGLSHAEVRLRGIAAPAPGTHFADDSRQYLAARLIAKPGGPPRPVTLKFDGTEQRDPAGRLFAYVYLDGGDCVNVDCVRDGVAYVDRRFKTVLQSTLDQAETQTRLRGGGLWKDLAFADMPAWRQQWVRNLRSRANK